MAVYCNGRATTKLLILYKNKKQNDRWARQANTVPYICYCVSYLEQPEGYPQTKQACKRPRDPRGHQHGRSERQRGAHDESGVQEGGERQGVVNTRLGKFQAFERPLRLQNSHLVPRMTTLTRE